MHHPFLDSFTNPVPHLGVVDVHEFESYPAGIGLIECFHHLSQLHLLAVAEKLGGCLTLEIAVIEAGLQEFQTGIARRGLIKRVDARLSVAKRAVVIHQTHHPSSEGQLLGGEFRGG